MTLFGLIQGQDLENRAAHPYKEFQGVFPRAFRFYFLLSRLTTLVEQSSGSFGQTTIVQKAYCMDLSKETVVAIFRLATGAHNPKRATLILGLCHGFFY